MALFSRSERHTVCIVGAGACTAIGYNRLSAAAAVRAGITGFHEHPYMIDRTGEKMIVARVDAVAPQVKLVERLEALASAAATEALAPLRQQPYGGATRMPAIIGLPASRPAGLGDLTPGFVERMLAAQDRLGFTQLSTFSTGHAAGLMALQAGVRQIEYGEADMCLIGGVDSYLDAETLEWLDESEQLHSEANTWGFVPGEAAGFCLLASTEAARRYGLDPLLRVLSTATANETNLIRTDTVCTGRGLTDAIKGVLRALPAGEKVHQTLCDMNGERYRADEFAFTVCRTSERFVSASDFLAPADCWGDVGAASGPLFLSLAGTAGRKGYAKGANTLLWASSDSGERSAALISGPVTAGPSISGLV